ncbi:MAG: ComEC/Rec2 family competence protein, partial [Abditibacteriota bacterium]|nr:ComEC/Rec2 family competence protein [Abditibacteriota bacterium]
ISAGDVCSVWVWLCGGLAVLAAGLLRRSAYICLFSLCFLLGAGIYTAGRIQPAGSINNVAGDIVGVSGTVVSAPEFAGPSGQLLKADRAFLAGGEKKVSGSVLLYSSSPVPCGARICVMERPEPVGPGGAFGMDIAEYMARKNVYLSLYSNEKNTEYLGFSGFPLAWAARFRDLLMIRASCLPGEASGLVLGMLLGDAGLVSDDLRDATARTGIIHLLAASGFHCGLIALLVRVIFGFLPEHRLRALVIILFLWAYVLLTGFAPGAVRGALCISMYLAGLILNKGGTKLSHYLFLSALVFLLADPAALFDIGFQLSYVCAAALLLLLPYALLPLRSVLYRRKPPAFVSGAGAALIASMCISAACFPLQSAYFYYFSFLGVIYNIVLSVPVTGFFYTGLAALVFAGAGPPGAITVYAASLTGEFTVWLIKKAAETAPLSVVGALPPFAAICWYCGLLLLLLFLIRRYIGVKN